MADLLTINELSAKLAHLDGWIMADNAINKTFSFESFPDSIKFVDRIAELAERQNHHPDIDIRYDKVTLTLSTHSAGGVTEQDIGLAQLIEKV